MAHQQPIALAAQERMVGKVVEVLVDGYDESNGVALCRSWREAPDVDGYVLVPGEHAAGDRLKVRITGALPYDLEARLLKRLPPLPREHVTEEEIRAALQPAPVQPTIGLGDISIL